MHTLDINEIYRKEYQRLLYSCFKITKDMQLAEDVVQETFIKAIKKKDSIKDNTKWSAWLSVIARRTAIDLVRSEARKQATPIESEELADVVQTEKNIVEEEVEFHAMLEQIKSMVLRLNKIYQEVIFLKINDGLQDAEIASHIDLKTTSVKTRLRRARIHLKEMLVAQVVTKQI
ncbi:RNA polymerase sigma factor [Oceanobacillus sp. CAU 1775]